MISFKEMTEEQLDEVLNRQQRIKVGQRMRRMAKRIAIKRRISMKKRASPEKLLKRARKAARNKLAKKFIKGKDMSKLSFADRERLELKLQKKKGAIIKIAKRLLPKIRASEKQRLANMRKKTGGDSKLRKDSFNFHDFCCDMLYDHTIEEATYQGKKVELNNPIRTSENKNKKFKVYVKNSEGNVVVVRFGDPKMSIKRDDPERRSNFRARHGCDNPGPKWKAKYWSCYQWRAGAKVDN
tara:strand:- start:16578 stop:17297 length:720 start_codon:yes stop_codon:yes gene_type:complete